MCSSIINLEVCNIHQNLQAMQVVMDSSMIDGTYQLHGNKEEIPPAFHPMSPRCFSVEEENVKNALQSGKTFHESPVQINNTIMESLYRDRQERQCENTLESKNSAVSIFSVESAAESWEKYKISTAALSDVSSCDAHYSPVQEPNRSIVFYQYLQSPQGQEWIREWRKNENELTIQTGQSQVHMDPIPSIPLHCTENSTMMNCVNQPMDESTIFESGHGRSPIPLQSKQISMKSSLPARKQGQKRRTSDGSFQIDLNNSVYLASSSNEIKKRQRSTEQQDQNRIVDRKRRRRESHNAVERRRRDLINDRIAELAMLLPGNVLLQAIQNSTGGGTEPHINLKPFVPQKEDAECNGNGIYSDIHENDFNLEALAQSKPNKGIILTKSVEYIKYLHEVSIALRKENVQLQKQIQSSTSARVRREFEEGKQTQPDEYLTAPPSSFYESTKMNYGRSHLKMNSMFEIRTPDLVPATP